MTRPKLSALTAQAAPLIPVLHVENAEHAEPLGDALIGGGITMIEVTLRTAAGCEVIRRMRKAFPQAIIGAGTVTRPEQLAQVRDAGALFAVSPALTPQIAEASDRLDMPFLPGAVTPSEILRARELGFDELKFFPADIMGGVRALKHYLPLFPDVRFCPTGGISDANVMSFLDLRNVFAAGGGWLAPIELIEARNWAEIAERTRRSVAVVSGR